MAIGDLHWTQRGGVLTLTERWQLTLGAIRKHIRLRWRARPAGAAGPVNALDRMGLRALEQVEHPWDALAFAASTAAQELQPQWLTNHGWRTYAWGTLLALKGDLQYDRSLFFSACMLHDLGLTLKHQFCNCMQIESRNTPQSRTGMYVRRLGFLDLIDLIEQAQFDE